MNANPHGLNKDESLKSTWTMINQDIDCVPLSPISVNTDHMRVINVPLLEFHNFEVKPERMNLRNNGRTVVLNGNWLTNKGPFITGSNLTDKYRFSHLHFHWSDDENGSEHVINGQRHALEMHLIFVNESFGTIFEAELDQRGSVTLAYLFDIQPEPHFGVDHVTNLCKNLTYGQMTDVPVFPLSHLINKHMHEEYFTYLGKYFKSGGKFGMSQWIVFTKAGGVSSKQMEQFRNILNKRSHTIKRNCRPTEPIKNTGLSPFLVKQSASNICHTAPSFEGKQDLRRNSQCLVHECSSLRAEQSNVTLIETVPRTTGKIQRLLCAKPTRTHLLRTKHNLCKMESTNYKYTTSNSSAGKINQTTLLNNIKIEDDNNTIPNDEQLQLVQLDNYWQYNVDSKFKPPPWK